MAKPILDDSVWKQIEPLLSSKPRRSRFPGRKPLDHRKALTGILFVLKTGIPWQDLPRELGCGSGMSCWRRLREWQQAGIWNTLEDLLMRELTQAHKIDWARVHRHGWDSPTCGDGDRYPSPRPSRQKTC